ncbi:hypothetical protein ERO13_D08G070733v2, partial [Gossypium hirsutum]
CYYGTEDILHALKDCPTTKDIWKLIVPATRWSQFFSGSLLEWIRTNLETHGQITRHEVLWPTLFGIILWRLWKNRNLFVFQGLPWTEQSSITKLVVENHLGIGF